MVRDRERASLAESRPEIQQGATVRPRDDALEIREVDVVMSPRCPEGGLVRQDRHEGANPLVLSDLLDEPLKCVDRPAL